jgi:hypothetical protein
MDALGTKIEISDTIHVVRAAPRKWEVREHISTGCARLARFRTRRAALQSAIKTAWRKS